MLNVFKIVTSVKFDNRKTQIIQCDIWMTFLLYMLLDFVILIVKIF